MLNPIKRKNINKYCSSKNIELKKRNSNEEKDTKSLELTVIILMRKIFETTEMQVVLLPNGQL